MEENQIKATGALVTSFFQDEVKLCSPECLPEPLFSRVMLLLLTRCPNEKMSELPTLLSTEDSSHL